jgi:hypothetical protein
VTFIQHIQKERYKVVLSSLTASLGFFVALFANSAVERHRERQAYFSQLNAIRVEALSNVNMLHESFERFFEDGIVPQEFNTSVVSQALSSPTFLKNSSTDEVAMLSSYLRNLTLANRYRERSEKWHADNKDDLIGALIPFWSTNLDACDKSITAVSHTQK